MALPEVGLCPWGCPTPVELRGQHSDSLHRAQQKPCGSHPVGIWSLLRVRGKGPSVQKYRAICGCGFCPQQGLLLGDRWDTAPQPRWKLPVLGTAVPFLYWHNAKPSQKRLFFPVPPRCHWEKRKDPCLPPTLQKGSSVVTTPVNRTVFSPCPLPCDTNSLSLALKRGVCWARSPAQSGVVHCAGAGLHSCAPRAQPAGGHGGGGRGLGHGSGRRLRSSDLRVPSQEVESAGSWAVPGLGARCTLKMDAKMG